VTSPIDSVTVLRLHGELNAIIRQDCVQPVGHDRQEVLHELTRRFSVGLVDQLCDCELACAVNADEEIKLSLAGLHLCDVHMKEADRVSLELLPLWLVALDIRQARDAMPL
jgi:hypothetical protein